MARAKAKAAKAANKSKAAKKGQAEKDRAKKAASAAAGTKPVKRRAAPAPDARKMPSAGQLKNLFDDVNGLLGRAKKLSGDAGKRVATAVADIGIDKVSFAFARKLELIGERDPNKLLTILENFDHVRKVRRIDDLAGPSLFEARTGAANGEDGEEDDQVEIPQATDGEGVPAGAPLN